MYSLQFRKLFYIIQRLRDAMRNGMSMLGTLGFFFSERIRTALKILWVVVRLFVFATCATSTFFSFFILSAGSFMIKIDAS